MRHSKTKPYLRCQHSPKLLLKYVRGAKDEGIHLISYHIHGCGSTGSLLRTGMVEAHGDLI